MITSVLDFVRGVGDEKPRKPWLVLGKGPTSDLLEKIGAENYHVLALNHACLITGFKLAHFTDIEAYADCQEKLPETSNICLPWWPHVGMRPGRVTLLRHANPSQGYSLLSWAYANDRLFSYNSTVAHRLERNKALPEIRVRYFSAVAAFNILARSGLKRIHTLGVDGGRGYGSRFDAKDRLANGRGSFDVQFDEIGRTCRQLKVEHVDLGGTR